MTALGDQEANGQVASEPDPAALAERNDDTARVLALLETLPDGQRETIRLKFQNGFSYKEISRITGYTVTNVGYLIHVGIKTLRERLELENEIKSGSPPVAASEVSNHALRLRSE